MKKLLLLLAVVPLIGLVSCENEEPVTKTYTFRSAIGSKNGIVADYRLIERTSDWKGQYVCENEIKNYQAGRTYDFIANQRTNAIFVEVTKRSSGGTETYQLPGFYYFPEGSRHADIIIGYD